VLLVHPVEERQRDFRRVGKVGTVTQRLRSSGEKPGEADPLTIPPHGAEHYEQAERGREWV
jgi:hypothetical protein